jgi:hypothetical protein
LRQRSLSRGISGWMRDALIQTEAGLHSPVAGDINQTMNQFVGRNQGMRVELHGSPLRGGGGEWKGIGVGRERPNEFR